MDKIDRILTRGVANIIPGKEELKKLLSSGKKLNVYLGIDPTATHIHLGHAVPLIKLQKLAELGHNVTFLIGDFTALIGDTSDKDSERPVLTAEEIEENFKTYKKQAEKILDFSKVKVRHNSEWLSKLTPADFIKLTQKFSLGDFISRELIKKRLAGNERIGLHEVLYPAMQGYDSYFMDTDIQIGGTDQTFNMQAGRTLQKLLRNKESFVLATEFLMGTDGRKMSKTWGNTIWLDDEPREMFGKIMSINDDLIVQYFTLVTRLPTSEIDEIRMKFLEYNRMYLKEKLAYGIVQEFYGKEKADEAKESFTKFFRKRDVSENLEPIHIPRAMASGASLSNLVFNAGGTASISEAKQLLTQGAIEVNNEKVIQPRIDLADGSVIRVGKRKAYIVILDKEE